MASDYSALFNKVIDLFKDDDLYKACVASDDALSEWRVFRKFSKKVLDTTWLDVIEENLVDLDVIVRNPRRFIVVEEDLIDTSRARSVTEESVKYLAQHTNYISGFDGDMILPSKLLNSTKEESYEVYENRFIYTLLRRLQAFIKKRYDAVKDAAKQNEQIEIVVDKRLSLGVANVTMRLDSIVKMPFEEAIKLNSEELGPIERLAKIHNIVSGFMVTPFAKEMVSSEPVRPPIQRTNAILKNQNFKKALALWEFLQGYDDDGYEIRAVTESEEMDEDLKNQYQLMVFFNSVFMQNLANESFKVKKSSSQTRTKNQNVNIDDFPKAEIPVDEIKTLNVASFYRNPLSDVDKAEIVNTLDRVLAQYKLNQINNKSKVYSRLFVAQRKRENEFKERILKLRKKEREELAKLERQKERERLRDERQAKDAELLRLKNQKEQQLRESRFKEFQKEILEEMQRLDDDALNLAVKESRTEQLNENRAKIAEEIIYFNKLRAKLKADYTKAVDEQIDELIKLIPKLFSINL